MAALCPAVLITSVDSSGRRWQWRSVRKEEAAPKHISPSAEEGGSRAVIDPFNWCGFNYDNRLPELLLFRFPKQPPPSLPPSSLLSPSCVFFFQRCFISWRPRVQVSYRCAASPPPSTQRNLLAANQRPPLHDCSDTCWEAGPNGELTVNWVAGKPANGGVWIQLIVVIVDVTIQLRPFLLKFEFLRNALNLAQTSTWTPRRPD